MKITLFRATGKTGPYLIEEGLKRGHEITVFARQSSSFDYENVRIVRGDFTDAIDLYEAINGADAVLSALGPTQFPHPKGEPIAHATQAMIDIMAQAQVRRLIAVSTGTAADPDDRYDMKIRLPAILIKYLMPSIYQDIVALAQVIRQSDRDWTMVRAGFLTNRSDSKGINVGVYGKTRHQLALSRLDLAKFMFDQIESDTYLAKAPGVSSC